MRHNELMDIAHFGALKRYRIRTDKSVYPCYVYEEYDGPDSTVLTISYSQTSWTTHLFSSLEELARSPIDEVIRLLVPYERFRKDDIQSALKKIRKLLVVSVRKEVIAKEDAKKGWKELLKKLGKNRSLIEIYGWIETTGKPLKGDFMEARLGIGDTWEVEDLIYDVIPAIRKAFSSQKY